MNVVSLSALALGLLLLYSAIKNKRLPIIFGEVFGRTPPGATTKPSSGVAIPAPSGMIPA